jgi:hypothetical protein
MPERPATPTRWLNASHPMRRSGTKGAPELTEIAAWRRETTEKYHHTVEPVAVAERGGEIIVATKSPEIFPAARSRSTSSSGSRTARSHRWRFSRKCCRGSAAWRLPSFPFAKEFLSARQLRTRHSGQPAGLNPESRDDQAIRFRVRASARPGMTETKKRDGIAPVASKFCFLAGPGAESALWQSVKSLAGDPSEVTALGVRHWITSFRC